RLKRVATCNAGGAGKWRPEYSACLAKKHVVILPDDDEPGRKHAEAVAKSVLPLAASVRIVPLPGAKDVSDWIGAGGTLKQLVELVKKAPRYRAEAANDASTQSADGSPDLLTQHFSDYGNSRRLIALQGQDMRYCYEFKKWLVWDGRRWAIDE